jgi:hypothetical protein
LIEREIFCYLRDCIPAVFADFLISILQRIAARDTHRRIEEIEKRPCEFWDVQIRIVIMFNDRSLKNIDRHRQGFSKRL